MAEIEKNNKENLSLLVEPRRMARIHFAKYLSIFCNDDCNDKFWCAKYKKSKNQECVNILFSNIETQMRVLWSLNHGHLNWIKMAMTQPSPSSAGAQRLLGPLGWFIIYRAYPVGCIFFYISKMFRTPFGTSRALCFVPLHNQSKNVSYPIFKKKNLKIPIKWLEMFHTPSLY